MERGSFWSGVVVVPATTEAMSPASHGGTKTSDQVCDYINDHGIDGRSREIASEFLVLFCAGDLLTEDFAVARS